MKLLSKLEKKTEVWFLLILSFLFFLLRLPSLFEPLWYSDEGIYEVIGIALNSGKLLYRDIWDNKPPLLYTLYAIFHGNQSLIRFACLIAGLISIVLFYFLTKKIFTKKNIQYGTTTLFAFLLAIPLLEGNIANAENFMMPYILGAALLLLQIKDSVKPIHKPNIFLDAFLNKQYQILFSAGILLGFAFLFKVVAIFDIGAFIVFFIFTNTKQLTIKQSIKKIIALTPLYLGFFSPFFCAFLFFLKQNALLDFIHAIFLKNVSYITDENQFIFPQGLLIEKFSLLGIFIFLIFIKKAHLSKKNLFVIVWLAFSLFNASFSQRPYTHYLLGLLSSFCLFIGMLFEKTKLQLLFFSIFFFILFHIFTNFSLYTKNILYYNNFLAFIENKKAITNYRNFFDEATQRDYALQAFFKTKLSPNDQIFIWGNNAQLYALLHKLPPTKYIVAYHITPSQQTRDETQKNLKKIHPKFIIIMPDQEKIPYSLKHYFQKIIINNAIIYERNF